MYMDMYEQNKCGNEDKPISAGRCMVAEAIGTKALKIESVRCEYEPYIKLAAKYNTCTHQCQ